MRMYHYLTARMVLMAEVSGVRVRGRSRLGWMDGMKVHHGLGKQRNDGGGCATMRRLRKSGEPWCIC